MDLLCWELFREAPLYPVVLPLGNLALLYHTNPTVPQTQLKTAAWNVNLLQGMDATLYSWKRELLSRCLYGK